MNPDNLLEFAERIAGFDPAATNPSILRRAVSTAYYALFHLLCSSGAKHVGGATAFQLLAARKYEHKRMKKVSESSIRRCPATC